MKFYKYSIRSIFILLFLMNGFFSIKANSTNFSSLVDSCISYNDEWHYAGDLHIPVSFDLKSDEESIDEARFASNLQKDLLKSEALYKKLEDSGNGRILDTDIARNLYEPYASILDRHNYVCSTLMPAAWFVDYLYYKSLIEVAISNKGREEGEKPVVVLLAGGDGSGKTSSIKQLGLEILDKATLIKDSTMSSDFEFHRNMVERTLELGLDVVLVYVFRPIELALYGNIQRAQIIGRVRPLVEIAEAHYKAQKNILKLNEHFGDRMKVLVIDNSNNLGEPNLVEEGITFLNNPRVQYPSQEAALQRAVIAYHKMEKALIPEFIVNLLERKLNTSANYDEGYRSESEKELWVTYLKTLILDLAKKLGL